MRPAWVVLSLVLATSAWAEPASTSEEQLVIDVKTLLADEAPRLSHVDPALPGTFGDLAVPYLLQLKACYDSLSDSDESSAARRAVSAGEKPLEELPAAWKETVKKCGPATDGLLRATHATTGKLPPLFTLFGQFSGEKAPYSMIQAQLAVKVASIEALLAVRDGNTGLAVDICADQLALARDISHACLIGQMISQAMVPLATPTCQLVLAKADPPLRRRFQQQLHTIQAGWTPMSVIFDDERLWGQIGPYYDTLSLKTQAALPPEAHLHLVGHTSGGGFTESVRWSLFGAGARREQSRILHEISEASLLPPAEADAKIAVLLADTPLLLTLAHDEASKATWVRFLERTRVGQARLVLLDLVASVRNFRSEHGTWPRAWADMGIATPVDPRTSKPLGLEPSQDGVALVPAQDGDRTLDDLRTVVR